MKPTKKINWLVDNLRHISYHGLGVEFADEGKKAFINSLKRDGATKIEAGQSWIKLVTVGRVTFTELFHAHGNYNNKAVHYLDESTNLRFTHRLTDNEQAFWTLASVITGHAMPEEWRSCAKWGSSQDAMREWARKWAWSLAGEHGLRAKSAEKWLAGLKGSLTSAVNEVKYHERIANEFEARDFDKEIGIARENTKAALLRNGKIIEGFRNDMETLDTYLAEAGAFPYSNDYYKYGMRSNQRFDGETRTYAPRFFIEGVRAKMSHEILCPNYVATRNGDQITLSSGIACDVTATQALAWLKGEAEAPRTRYGPCTKIGRAHV